MSSFTDRARSALSRIEQDERVRSTTAAARNVASQAEGVPQTVSRKGAEDDARDELRGDRQRRSAYYLYSALLAGLIRPYDLAQARRPPELADPLRQRGLDRFAPRPGRA